MKNLFKVPTPPPPAGEGPPPVPWTDKAEAKREEIEKALPEAFRLPNVPDADQLNKAIDYPLTVLSQKEIAITEAPVGSLLVDLASAKLSAVDALNAFAHRATIAHDLTNCLSEVFIEKARDRAKKLDDYLAKNKKPYGPLHGLPVSVNDQFNVEGAETTLGYVGWIGKKTKKEQESLAVQILSNAGAVIFVKTNVATSVMAMETDNNIIGYTWNPFNRSLSAAGSSGGEAALIAMRGSAMGLGSDSATCIRLPASMQGLFGLKPSHGRLPFLGTSTSMEGSTLIRGVVGPMGHDPLDLTRIVKTLLKGNPWKYDPEVIEFPWREEKTKEIGDKIQDRNRRLTFGVLYHDGVVMPHPPVQRALSETVAALKKHGHKIVEWTPPAHSTSYEITWASTTADGGNDIHLQHGLSGEPLIPQLSAIYGEGSGHLPIQTISESWGFHRKQNKYRAAYLAYWHKEEPDVDFILSPVTAATGFTPGSAIYSGYTAVANVLDFTAMAIPVTKADKFVDKVESREEFLGRFDETVYKQYQPEKFHGIPVGVQIMGKRLDEERVLAVTQEVQKCLLHR